MQNVYWSEVTSGRSKVIPGKFITGAQLYDEVIMYAKCRWNLLHVGTRIVGTN